MQASADAGSPENPYRTILESCVGLLFFGVPNQGLETSELLSVVGDQNNAHLLQDLKKSSNLLRTMHEDFVEILFSIRDCEVVSFFQGNEKVRFFVLNYEYISDQEANMCHSTVHRNILTQHAL